MPRAATSAATSDASVGVEPEAEPGADPRGERRLEERRGERRPVRLGEDLGRRAVEDDPAGAHHDDPLERLGHEPHVVADRDDRSAGGGDRSATILATRATPRASWPVVGSSRTTTGVSIARIEARASSFRRE